VFRQQWRDDIQAFCQSPDGQWISAAEHAGEAELQTWACNLPSPAAVTKAASDRGFGFRRSEQHAAELPIEYR
jgi:hypothetical protein